jgi:hypothetical protein
MKKRTLKTSIGLVLIALCAIGIYSCNQADTIPNPPATAEQRDQTTYNPGTEEETENGAEESGHAISSVLLSLNSLSQSEYCDLMEIINDGTLDDQEKWDAIGENPVLDNYATSVEDLANTFQAFDYPTLWDDPNQREIIVSTITEDIGVDPDWTNRPNEDPCLAYHAALNTCSNNLGGCMAMGAFGCLGSVFGYIPCVAAITTICSVTAVNCVNSADATYPDCVPPGKVTFNPWIGDPDACNTGGGNSNQ